MNNSIFSYENGVAVVTGGTKGIGKEIALMLGKANFKVAIIGQNEERGMAVTREITEGGGSASFFKCDVSDDVKCRELFDKISSWSSNICCLVNCAGILTSTPLLEITREEWDRVIAVNLTGTFFMIQAAIPYLKKAQFGRIINISSNAGRMGGYANSQSYTATKGAIISITKGIARQLAPLGITCNVVCPGTTETEMVSQYSEETKKELISRIPLSRLGSCSEVASAVCYLSSIESGFITGATLDVNGGLYM